MKTETYTVTTWIKRKPFLAVLFAWNFGALATYAGSRQDLLPLIASAFCLLLAGWIASYWLDKKKLTALVVICALSIAPLQAEPEPATLEAANGGIIFGVAVIIVGGIVYFGLRRLCQRLFPPPPKQPVNEDEDDGEASADPPVTVAMSYAEAEYVCFEAASQSQPIGIIITVDVSAEPRIKSIQLSSLLMREDYEAALAGHGIGLTNSYSHNGVPCEPGGVPISAGLGGIVVGEGVTLTLECSPDMRVWTPMVTVTMTPGTQAVFADTASGAVGFYRVRTP